ncbi:MAG: hypothetical protein WKF30_16315 [Pyrinomonadaceae bacterium]
MSLLFILLLTVAGQFNLPAREATQSQASSLADLAPPGWHLLKSAEGDLNGDGRADAALVFTQSHPAAEDAADESEEALEAPRRLMIALRDEHGALRETVASDGVIICGACGVMIDEPLLSLSIKRGQLFVEQNIVGGCDISYAHRIRLSKGGWQIAGEVQARERRTGRQRTIKQNKSIALADFAVSEIDACRGSE